MMKFTTVHVDLGARSYNILIGDGILSDPQLLTPHVRGSNVVLVTNTTLWPILGQQLFQTLLAAGIRVHPAVLRDGEAEKSVVGLDEIYRVMLENHCDRHTTVVALGGGVVGDLAGFAAATFQRGIPFIQIPTSLLAMVDSSVGGKTAINHELGKNMIGAFHQPACVIADTATLATLPDREFRSAMSEVVKYGLICNPEFLEWIESSVEPILARDKEAISHAICRSCEIKASIVVKDEFETDPRGTRAQLNLGHTFGHALESVLGYGTWLHGEAVSCGIVLASELAQTHGLMCKAEVARVAKLLGAFDLPVSPPDATVDEMYAYMRRDKKNSGDTVRLILLNGIGRAELIGIDHKELLAFLSVHFRAN